MRSLATTRPADYLPLRSTDHGPRLVGSRCGPCRAIAFPSQPTCPRCGAGEVVEELLEPRGTLWTWTVQTFPPKAPYRAGSQDFAPYGVGYIELPGQLRIEARLTEHRPDHLCIGMPMELTTIPLPGGESDGLETFAFAPIEESR
jgi:uncharacterized OB-fold protein